MKLSPAEKKNSCNVIMFSLVHLEKKKILGCTGYTIAGLIWGQVAIAFTATPVATLFLHHIRGI